MHAIIGQAVSQALATQSTPSVVASSAAQDEDCPEVHPPHVAAHIPQTVLSKTWRGSFLDFSTLLKDTLPSSSNPPPLAKRVRLSADSSGEDTILSVTTVNSLKRKVVDLHSWLEAWTVYLAVALASCPGRARSWWAIIIL